MRRGLGRVDFGKIWLRRIDEPYNRKTERKRERDKERVGEGRRENKEGSRANERKRVI